MSTENRKVISKLLHIYQANHLGSSFSIFFFLNNISTYALEFHIYVCTTYHHFILTTRLYGIYCQHLEDKRYHFDMKGTEPGVTLGTVLYVGNKTISVI